VTASTQGAVNLSGVLCGLLSNVCLQARNLVNKRLMGQGEKGALSPNQLLSVSFLLALSIQLPIHALFVAARGEQAASPGSERDGLVWAWRWLSYPRGHAAPSGGTQALRAPPGRRATRRAAVVAYVVATLVGPSAARVPG